MPCVACPGKLPNSIGISGTVTYLINLTTLDASWNQVKSTIPPPIGNLTNLTELNLQSNMILGRWC